LIAALPIGTPPCFAFLFPSPWNANYSVAGWPCLPLHPFSISFLLDWTRLPLAPPIYALIAASLVGLSPSTLPAFPSCVAVLVRPPLAPSMHAPLNPPSSSLHCSAAPVAFHARTPLRTTVEATPVGIVPSELPVLLNSPSTLILRCPPLALLAFIGVYYLAHFYFTTLSSTTHVPFSPSTLPTPLAHRLDLAILPSLFGPSWPAGSALSTCNSIAPPTQIAFEQTCPGGTQTFFLTLSRALATDIQFSRSMVCRFFDARQSPDHPQQAIFGTSLQVPTCPPCAFGSSLFPLRLVFIPFLLSCLLSPSSCPPQCPANHGCSQPCTTWLAKLLPTWPPSPMCTFCLRSSPWRLARPPSYSLLPPFSRLLATTPQGLCLVQCYVLFGSP
jgi:hypothetical protein